MSSKAILEFVDTLLVQFPPFRWEPDQKKTFIQSMVRELGGYSEDVLKRALQHMIRTRKDRRTPLPADCIAACKEAKFWVDAERRATELPVEKLSDGGTYAAWTPERTKLADDLVMAPIGRQAAKEGWILSLHNFARENMRLPTEYEMPKVKAAAKDLEAGLEKARRGGWPQATEWVDYGAKMLNRRAELAEMVLHGVVR